MIDIRQGDCLELMKKLPNNSIDLVVTDLPYVLDNSRWGGGRTVDVEHLQELDSIKNGFSTEILDELCRVMKRINIYIFCSQKQIIPLLDYFVTNKNCNWNLLTWHKTNPVPACGNKYLNDTEYILFFRETGVKIYGEFNTKFTYYVTPLNNKDKKKYNHPTVKPVSLLSNFILNSSTENEIVLDPFMGSGTTGEACLLTGRKFIGYEINPDYFMTADRRLDEARESSETDKNQLSFEDYLAHRSKEDSSRRNKPLDDQISIFD